MSTTPDIQETNFDAYPIVNAPQMREIFGIDETGEFLKEVLDESMEQALTTCAEIKDAMAQKNYETVRERAHFLKGSMAQLGLQRLNHICLIIQYYFDKTPENQISKEHVDILIHELEKAISASLQYLYVTPDKSKINDQVFELLNSTQ